MKRSKQIQSQAEVWASSPPLMPVGQQDYRISKEEYEVEYKEDLRRCFGMKIFWNEEDN